MFPPDSRILACKYQASIIILRQEIMISPRPNT